MDRQLYNMGSGEEIMEENVQETFSPQGDTTQVQEGIMQVAPQGAQQNQAEQYRPIAEDLAKDPKKALALLIKMLIEQGVPPEQAEKIAMEMIQGVAEGGMEEVSEDTRVEARFGGRMGYASGGIGRLVDREQYGFGSFFKKVTSIPRKLVKGVKSVAKSPLGRMALTVAAGYYLGPAGLNIGSGMGAIGGGALRAALGNLAVQAVSGQKINFKEALAAGAIGGVVGGVQQANTLNTGVTDSSGQFGGQENLTINEDTYGGGYSQADLDYANSVTSAPAELNYANSITSAPTTANVVKNAPTSNFASIKDYVGDSYNTGIDLIKEYPKTAIAGAGILASMSTGQPKQNPGESMEDFNRRVKAWKTTLNANLGNTRPYSGYSLPSSANNPLYPVRVANGGRIGYQQGGISELTQQSFYEPMAMMAQGGRIGYADGFAPDGVTLKNSYDVIKNMDNELNPSTLDQMFGVITGKMGGEDEGASLIDKIQEYKYGRTFPRETISKYGKNVYLGQIPKPDRPAMSMDETINELEKQWDKLIEEGYEPGKTSYFDDLGIYKKEDIERRISLGFDQAMGPKDNTKQLAANGGRIGYQQGGISELTQQSFYEPMAMMAQGGRMGYAYGNSVEQGIMSAPQIADQMGMPVGNPRQNQQGITELDYRNEGGFVPPIGIKEKEDDIPAMLSNNEFVFTADAVKNAGGGDPNVGAQKMYAMMKQLENGGRA